MKPKKEIRVLKIRRVAEMLQNILLPLPVGGRLPGIRDLMKKTGAGQLVVCQVLRNMQKEGLIRIEPYQGIFRAGLPEPSDEIRLLHWSLVCVQSGFVDSMYRTFERLVAEAGRKITFENAGHRSKEEITEELLGQGISRCILSGALTADFARYLHRHMKICLELFPRHMEQIMPELRNSPDMTAIQLNYLMRSGYRRIGYFHYGGNNMTMYPVQIMRLMDYYRMMAENHLYVDPDWVFHCSDRYENLETGLIRMMKADQPPEAVIVPGGTLQYLYPLCRKHKIRIGKDLAVFSQDETNEKFTPEPTAITNNPVEIAKTFWQMFQAAERGENVGSRYTELFIRTGQTVPRLKTRP